MTSLLHEEPSYQGPRCLIKLMLKQEEYFYSLHAGNFIMSLLSSDDFFQNYFFQRKFFFQEHYQSAKRSVSPGLEVIKLFSCSTQLSTKFILLINVKMSTTAPLAR